MSRGLGVLDALSSIPDAVVVAAAVLTQLGDVWFLFGLVGLLYWFGETLPGPVALDRRRAAYVIGLGLGANALVTTLKTWLALQRPPGAATAPSVDVPPSLLASLFADAATGTGFGFPSGHALATAVVYGGLALLVGTRRAHVTAATVVAVVALTRVVLGVHYLVDVVVGVAVGATYLAVVHYAALHGDAPARALAAAMLVALLGPVLGNVGFETMTALGAALGAWLAWTIIGDHVEQESATRRGGVASVAVGAAFGVLFAVVFVLEPAAHFSFLAMAVVLAGVVASPLAGEALAREV
jgi:membrane-associated phospholipid phosphatase